MATNQYFAILYDGYNPYIILTVVTTVFLCWKRLSICLDPAEPPLLKPTIPYIGHIIGILTHHTGYYNRLFTKHPVSICTLPLLTERAYLITSPTLIQSAFRSKNLSFEPYMVDLAQTMLGISDEGMKPILAPATAETPSFLTQFINAIHGSMTPKNLQQMNAEALNQVAVTLNGLEKVFEPKSFFLWVRQFVTVATCDALLGSHNPTKKDPGLVESLWDFEGSIFGFVLKIFPSYIVPKGVKGRADLQKALIEYYTAKHDLEPDVAQMTKARAEVYRKNGLNPVDIGRFELAHLHVSTANAVPTVFWNLLYIFADPEVTSAIRKEILTIITEDGKNEQGKRVFKLDITKFDDNCPLLVSTYRETIRLVNSHLGTRRVMADTTISDGNNSYLLRKGADCMMPAGVTHLSASIWGPDASSFNARRFLAPSNTTKLIEKEKAADKQRKGAYIPFGGGKHLCPGRNFAFAEVLGTVAVLVQGWDILGVDGGLVNVPVVRRARLGEGVVKPRGKEAEMGARVVRRVGWEDVIWSFVVV